MTETNISESADGIGSGAAVVLLSAGLFALNTPFAAYFYGYGGDPLIVMLARNAAAALITGGLAFMVGQSMRLDTKKLKVFAFLAFGQFLQGACYLGSVAFIPVSLAALIFFTWPLMVALAAPIAGDGRPSPKAFAFFGLAFLGLALALGPDIHSLDIRGIVLAVGGAIGVTLYLVFGRKALRDTPMLPLATYTNIGAMIFSGITWFILAGDLSWTAAPDRDQALLVLLLICGVYSFGILTQVWALKRTPAPLVGLLYNLEPVLSIIAAALLLSERLNGQQMTGSAIVIASLIAFSLISKRKLKLPAKKPS